MGRSIHTNSSLFQEKIAMPNMKFNYDELDLLRAAVSYLLDNIPDAEDHLDIDISEDDVIELELKLAEEEGEQ